MNTMIFHLDEKEITVCEFRCWFFFANGFHVGNIQHPRPYSSKNKWIRLSAVGFHFLWKSFAYNFRSRLFEFTSLWAIGTRTLLIAHCSSLTNMIGVSLMFRFNFSTHFLISCYNGQAHFVNNTHYTRPFKLLSNTIELIRFTKSDPLTICRSCYWLCP